MRFAPRPLMRKVGSLLVLTALVSGCPEQRDGRALGARRPVGTERATPAASSVSNTSAPEAEPRRDVPEGPGQDHGTRALPSEEHGAQVCVEGEVRSRPEGDICQPGAAPSPPTTPPPTTTTR